MRDRLSEKSDRASRDHSIYIVSFQYFLSHSGERGNIQSPIAAPDGLKQSDGLIRLEK